MKKYLPVVVLVLSSVTSLTAFDGYLEITNFAEFSITEIYLSHVDDESLSENLLENQVLADGDTFRIDILDKPSSIFNIQLTDENNRTYTFNSFDIEQEDVLVTPDSVDPVIPDPRITQAELNGPGGDFEGILIIRNRSSFDIAELHIKHTVEEELSDNILGDSVIPDGEDFSVNLYAYPSQYFDIYIVDEGSDTYSFDNIDAEEQVVRISLEVMN